MSTNMEHRPAHATMAAPRLYPSELLPSLQSLLATLADLDFEHESDVETVRNSSADDWLKQTVIKTLDEQHQQRRAPYIEHLERLQKRMLALVT